jgi:hypothetical protein
MYKTVLRLALLIVMQTINMGSLVMNPSTLVSKVFAELDCRGSTLSNPIDKILVYSQNVAFGGDDNIENTKKFKSIWLSRPLQDQEQLDLSRSGQDNGQSQVWACGEYIMNFRNGTESGCHNIPNEGTAECIRLWHY